MLVAFEEWKERYRKTTIRIRDDAGLQAAFAAGIERSIELINNYQPENGTQINTKIISQILHEELLDNKLSLR